MAVNSGFTDGAYGELITKDKMSATYSFLIPANVAGGNQLFSWGRNDLGGLGLGDTAHRSSPVQVGTLLTWNNVACGYGHAMATRTDGSLWAWGKNTLGGLGLGDRTNRSSPVQVGTLLTWNNIACGYQHTVATKTDGSLWAWGKNGQFGHLGLGDVVNRSSPVQVGTLLTWNKVAGGYDHTVATKTDGSLWTWGRNDYGALGLGDTAHRSSPVQVGSLLNWDKIAGGAFHTIATKTDGSLWAWGENGSGNLGLGDTNRRSSPVQVGSLLTWNKVACGGSHTVAAQTDGSLWTWGFNNQGQLGLGDVTPRSSPVQVGTLLTWNNIACGSGGYFTVATKTDGSLWSCGYNQYGELGLSDVTTKRSSPVQVGSLLTWNKVACQQKSVIATITIPSF